MERNVYVHKIGGAGLMMDRGSLTSLLFKIKTQTPPGAHIIFVVSALAGVTRLLDNLAKAIKNKEKDKIDLLFMNFKMIHEEMINRLIPFDRHIHREIDKYYCQMDSIINREVNYGDKERANLLKYGELCSSVIFRVFADIFIPTFLLDARECIITDNDSHIFAKVDLPLTLDKIESKINGIHHNSIVTQGYIARNYLGEDTALGYDGSDLTAAIFALALLKDKENKVFLSYWKDILGVWENPNKESDGIFGAMIILDYLEFAEQNHVPVRVDALKILSSIDPSRIKIFIRSFLDLKNPGTLITP
jgi:aspartokinase